MKATQHLTLRFAAFTLILYRLKRFLLDNAFYIETALTIVTNGGLNPPRFVAMSGRSRDGSPARGPHCTSSYQPSKYSTPASHKRLSQPSARALDLAPTALTSHASVRVDRSVFPLRAPFATHSVTDAPISTTSHEAFTSMSQPRHYDPSRYSSSNSAAISISRSSSTVLSSFPASSSSMSFLERIEQRMKQYDASRYSTPNKHQPTATALTAHKSKIQSSTGQISTSSSTQSFTRESSVRSAHAMTDTPKQNAPHPSSIHGRPPAGNTHNASLSTTARKPINRAQSVPSHHSFTVEPRTEPALKSYARQSVVQPRVVSADSLMSSSLHREALVGVHVVVWLADGLA